MPPKVEMGNLGNQFGKPDMERLGLFSEVPYMNGKGYVSPFATTGYLKGKNMLPGGRKSKNATQHGYFDTEFRRVFEGEAITRVKKKDTKFTGKTPFMPPAGPKAHSTPGDHYGTFGGITPAFSAPYKPKPPYKKELPNCKIGAMKYGNCGYADIGLSRYPEHLPDPFQPRGKPPKKDPNKRPMINVHFPKPYFNPNPYMDDRGFGPTYVRPKGIRNLSRGTWVPTGPAKWQGGNHDGCFTKFPEHMPDKFMGPPKPIRKAGGQFLPQSHGKKMLWNFSTVYLNTDFRCNVKNYVNYEPGYIKHLVS